MTFSMKRTRPASQLALLGAALLTALTGFGCSEEEEEEIHPQLAYRQQLLAESLAYQFANPPETVAWDCTTTLMPGTDPNGDDAMLRTAVLNAESWDVICLEAGTYEMGMNGGNPSPGTVTITSTANLTIKGIGESVEDMILDFDGQVNPKGFNVSAPGFWIENLWIKNTKNNGVEVKATNAEENPNVFRKLKVTWDAGSVTENGAYSIYPTRSTYIIAEFSEVVGASDAGLYIGQVEHGIVRYNYVHGNVAGLEVENSYDVEVIGNAVTDNTGGILALQEPGLARLDNEKVLIRYNEVWANNRQNFAVPGTAVSNVPAGTGLMAFAGTNIEFRDNDVHDNETTGLLIVSNVLLDDLDGGTSPYTYPDGYNPYPGMIYSNQNTYEDNGTDPDPLLLLALGFPPLPIEPIIWDGYISDGVEAVGVPPVDDPQICLGTPTPDLAIVRYDPKQDDLDFGCDLPELPTTVFPSSSVPIP